jgi:hypothetical protein
MAWHGIPWHGIPLAFHWHSIGIPLAFHWHSIGIPLAWHTGSGWAHPGVEAMPAKTVGCRLLLCSTGVKQLD